MPIVEFTSETPIFRRALEEAPSTTVTVIDDRMPPDGAMKLIFRAEGPALDSFEDGLGVDPTIATVRRLDGADDGRLFRVSYTTQGIDQSITSVITDEDATLSDAIVSDDGVWYRIWFPDRDSLRRIREWSHERHRSFRVEKIYNAEPTETGTPYGLTEAQLEAIRHCFRDGYFQVPRQTTCTDVAEKLGISSQSVSERLRRGLATVIEGTGLVRDDGLTDSGKRPNDE
ncbi:GAF and HTH_10 associated domain-containing protein [Halogranum amylolyticum]|uniref:GAF and HTH_10 associated domain-containing protein n=1 Tax=Halogranum amylolyticum TaxID=660520 RepID=A0A1H8P8A5_9EURY|nr:helix-turn-helix domain-containing protein [Halogranum amylolyticum]SEO38142.1 GAF and HTH_10 associated domain-containing protein [Halogranum amylolyticum]